MSATVIALATTLTIVVILASVLIALMYVRLRQRPSYDGAVEASPLTPGFGIFKFIPPWHPAAQITPFGSSPQAPVFKSEPGTNMRIAHRNSNGVWEFFDSGLPEHDRLPRPQSMRSSIFTRSTRLAPSSPGSVSSSSQWTIGPAIPPSREFLTTDFTPAAPPPPAYCKDDKH